MSLLFANAWLWPFVAAIAVPILLHLFARARPPIFPFSSLLFLRRVIREQQRVRKPRDWLLLALRTLLVAGLVTAFLQPLWFGGHPARAGAGRNVVVIVDATASMACRDGAQPRFAAACGEAADVLSGLSARDRANLIWLRTPPQAVFPGLGVNIGYLRDCLRQGRVSTEAGDPAAALRLASDLLRGVEGRREICIVSDFQQTTWRELGTGVAPGIDVVTVPVARGLAGNLAITRLFAQPAVPLAGEDANVFVEVSNFSDAPRQTGVQAEIGELRASRNVLVPAWGKATAAFRVPCRQAGELTAAATIGEDDFSGDNAAWMVMSVKPGLRVGLLAAETGTAPYWRQALRALPWAQVVDLAAAGWDADAQGCDALLLCGWDGAQPAPVRAALAAGKPVIWYPARGTSAAGLTALTSQPNAAASGFDWLQPREALGLKLVEADDPALAIFAGGDRGNPAAGFFRGRLSVPVLPDDTHVLLKYGDGTPALARLKAAGGTLILWNLALAPDLSGWATRTEFLPLFAELLLTSRGAGTASASSAVLAGQELVLRPERDLLPQSMRVDNPDGQSRLVTRRESAAGPVYTAGRAERPGLYTWRLGHDLIAQTAVNFPPEESDLRTIPPPAIARSGWAAVSGGRAARERRDGIPLWPWCLSLALVCGLAEAGAALWAAKP